MKEHSQNSIVTSYGEGNSLSEDTKREVYTRLLVDVARSGVKGSRDRVSVRIGAKQQLDAVEHDVLTYIRQSVAVPSTNCRERQERFLLTAREVDVIIHSYGLHTGKPMTPREVALSCGVTESTISTYKKSALLRLRSQPSILQHVQFISPSLFEEDEQFQHIPTRQFRRRRYFPGE